MQAILHSHSVKTYDKGQENKTFLQTRGVTDTVIGTKMFPYMSLTCTCCDVQCLVFWLLVMTLSSSN